MTTSVSSFASPVSAQSLFESLFGSEPRPTFIVPPIAPETARREAPRAPAPKWRTVCVRLCDGYFFPLSHGVTRASFSQDENVCRARCSSEARMFYMRTDKSIDDATDRAGAPYSSLPNAYRYRQAQVSGCTCRPEPWAASEIARHAGYAAAERAKVAAATGGSPAGQRAGSAAGAPPSSPTGAKPARNARVAAAPNKAPPAPRVVVARGLMGDGTPPRTLAVVPAKGLFGAL